MTLVLVGTSHHLAPVELRERLGLDPAAVARLAGDGGEAVLLSTCNRVCLYLVHEDAESSRSRAVAELASASRLPASEVEPFLYVKRDGAAAAHLFRVAAGLDSLVPGEAQIQGQVRAALEAAERAGSSGPILHRLFGQALHVGRRVRLETMIAETPGSVSAAAAALAARVFEDLGKATVLLVGAGKMGALAAAGVVAHGATRLVVANRSVERAEQLALRVGGRPVGLDALDAELVHADVVIASTGSRDLVLTAAQVERSLKARRGRPIFLIDIAVPRDLDPAINALPGCYLYDIDDLERVVDEGVAGGAEELAKAEAIVSSEAERFSAWQQSLDVVPAIASLRRRAEEIRASELARAGGRLAGLTPSERRAVESLTAQIVSKLLHVPTVRLKEAAAAPEGVAYAETVRRLFDLDTPAP
jgi:glutamyl-tRNA reductase